MMSLLAMVFFSAAMNGSVAITPHIVCDNPGTWVFNSRMEEVSEAVSEFRVDIKSEKAAVPPGFKVEFSIPQKGEHHVWAARMTRSGHSGICVDWEKLHKSNIANSIPLACAKDCGDRNRLTVAASEAKRDVGYGIRLREEGCLIKVDFDFFAVPEAERTDYSVKILIDQRDVFWGDAVRNAVDWIAKANGYKSAIAPKSAFEPLYSTWYQFHQDVTAEKIEKEAALAGSLGIKTLIVDDGWQTDDTSRGYAYCGDWEVSMRRFPNMAEHVKKVKAMGIKYMMWYSVPMMGKKSKNYKRFLGKYLYFNERYGAGVLDPRFPEVREYLASIYEKAQKEWNIDGFKFDFIDSFVINGKDPAIEQQYSGRDFRTVSDAVDALLSEIVSRLRKNNPDVLIEFRQNYIGPVITQYGNMIRAADCPGDRQANRVRIADLRLTSAKAAVHADMLEWNVAMSAEEAAGSVISSIFGVVQYSMMLSKLPDDHLKMVSHWIEFCRKHENALYHGKFYGYSPECGYPELCGEDDKERIIGVYGNNRVVNIGKSKKQAIILNGTGVSGLCIETRVKRRCEIYDTFGKEVTKCDISLGIVCLNVPIGGYVFME